jgi:predicted dehydrogenase
MAFATHTTEKCISHQKSIFAGRPRISVGMKGQPLPLANIEERGANRRTFLRVAATAIAAASTRNLLQAQASPKPGAPRVRSTTENAVSFPPLHASTEASEQTLGPFDRPSERIGFAIVGLGHLSLGQILPAFGKSKHCRPVALASGDREKARKIAAQYGIRESSIYDYESYEDIGRNPEVQVIYIVLPNSMHAEYVIRGARSGKHILCEKPMATTSADCERMIAACKAANVKLMIAYRQQYEPLNKAIVKMVRDRKLGALRSMIASNAQNQGDPSQWRQKLALSGGGCLPDVGIYCLNAARFLSGEEPSEVWASLHQPKDDPRFREVEETCSFVAKFPSGLIASCSSGYGAHRSQFMRLEGDLGWAELNPAFGYTGLRFRASTVQDGHDVISEPSIEAEDQFAIEMDHMAFCVQNNLQPHTPGEEGLQDQRIIEAIYQSARTGKSVSLATAQGAIRGPEPITS